MNRCRLCGEITTRPNAELWNQPLLDTEHFVAIPSLGSLVEGWLLLVPKQHAISFGALHEGLLPEVRQLKDEIVTALQREYGPVCMFEHGPSKENQRVGCGVDHAHLHFVPMDFDLKDASRCFLPEGACWYEAVPSDCQRAYLDGKDYLYIEQPLGHAWIATSSNFTSQVLRRAIAKEVGLLDQFNWREYPQLPNIESTVLNLQKRSPVFSLWKSNPEAIA